MKVIVHFKKYTIKKDRQLDTDFITSGIYKDDTLTFIENPNEANKIINKLELGKRSLVVKRKDDSTNCKTTLKLEFNKPSFYEIKVNNQKLKLNAIASDVDIKDDLVYAKYQVLSDEKEDTIHELCISIKPLK